MVELLDFVFTEHSPNISIFRKNKYKNPTIGFRFCNGSIKKPTRRPACICQYSRGPKIEVPMRTKVAPYCRAIWYSSDIPIESSLKEASQG